VDQISNETTCKRFVLKHHYSGSIPPAIASFGLFEATGVVQSRLVGIACFTVPMNWGAKEAALLQPEERPAELGRFVLLDEVGANAETWFLSRALRGFAAAKRSPNGEGGTKARHPICVSYSDPVPRTSEDGRITFRGHFGHVYGPAGGGIYTGRGSRKTIWLCRDGSALVARTLNKLRASESGDAHVYRMMLAAGAPRMKSNENPRSYVERALRDGPFRRILHAGNHRYIFTLGSYARQRTLKTALQTDLPYPNRTDVC
jgi:hypothetical protein